MDCPNCGQWNPDDKRICWRCDAELPRPTEKKPKKPARLFFGLPVWTWVILIFMLIVLFAGQCFAPLIFNRGS